jgi:hypothetical protein
MNEGEQLVLMGESRFVMVEPWKLNLSQVVKSLITIERIKIGMSGGSVIPRGRNWLHRGRIYVPVI